MTRKELMRKNSRNGSRTPTKPGVFTVVYCSECFKDGREIGQKSCGVKAVVAHNATKATCKYGHSIPVHNRANKYHDQKTSN